MVPERSPHTTPGLGQALPVRLAAAALARGPWEGRFLETGLQIDCKMQKQFYLAPAVKHDVEPYNCDKECQGHDTQDRGDSIDDLNGEIGKSQRYDDKEHEQERQDGDDRQG